MTRDRVERSAGVNWMSEPSRELSRHARVGVLDIGSNSIRLVVYDRAGRSSIQVFNEKALCGLGYGVSETGNLSVEGMASAAVNLDRFAQIARAMRIGRLDVVATSAVRDARNGAVFVAEIERRLGHTVRVISGDEEARLSALGVLSGFPVVDGVVGDLGGGSLELVNVADRQLGAYATMPIGPLRLGVVDRRQDRRLSSMIDSHLDTAPWLPALNGRTFYAVGGAWRGIAKTHMTNVGYPLEIVHGYTVEEAGLSAFLSGLSRLSNKAIRATPGVPRRRADTLPDAALILHRVLARGKPERVVFSAFGLREGCLYDRLSEGERNADPLLVTAAEIARETNRFAPNPDAVFAWLAPLFPALEPNDERLVRALCMLSDIAWSEHPSYRGEHAFLRVLRLPVAGLEHPDRVFLGLGVLVRYVGHADLKAADTVRALLPPDRCDLAIQVGHALRLGLTLSGVATNLLRRTRLKPTSKGFTLSINPDAMALIGEVVERRIKALAGAIGRPVLVAARRRGRRDS